MPSPPPSPGRPATSRLLLLLALLAASCCCGAKPRKGTKDPCICDNEEKPVCASNFFTYGNKCKYECIAAYVRPVNLTILHDGPCVEADLEIILGIGAGSPAAAAEDEGSEGSSTSTTEETTSEGSSTTTTTEASQDPGE